LFENRLPRVNALFCAGCVFASPIREQPLLPLKVKPVTSLGFDRRALVTFNSAIEELNVLREDGDKLYATVLSEVHYGATA
jgi:hypothetical protein